MWQHYLKLIILRKHYFSVLTFYEKWQKSIFLINYCNVVFSVYTEFQMCCKHNVRKSFIIFIKTLLFCANFSWKMLKIVFSDEVLCNIWLCVMIIPKMCVIRTVQTLCKKVWKTMFYGQKTELHTHVFTTLRKMCKTCIKV
jgi:hypothetical protein